MGDGDRGRFCCLFGDAFCGDVLVGWRGDALACGLGDAFGDVRRCVLGDAAFGDNCRFFEDKGRVGDALRGDARCGDACNHNLQSSFPSLQLYLFCANAMACFASAPALPVFCRFCR